MAKVAFTFGCAKQSKNLETYLLDIHKYLLDHKNSKNLLLYHSFQGIVPLETKRKKLIGWLKEEKSGGIVDWPFTLCNR